METTTTETESTTVAVDNILMIRADDRERDVIECLTNRNATVTVARLDLGDFLIGEYIFERKTKADLFSSITDGRYHEQKSRMLECFGSDKIIYIIEMESGNFVDEDTKMNSIFNMMVRDGIRILRTTSHLETAVALMKFAESCRRHSSGKLSNVTNIDALTRSRGKTKKTDTFYLSCLQLLPGVSSVTAKIIMEKYPTLDIFINTAKNNIEEIGNINTGKRRLGNAVAKKISATLFPQST